MTKEDRVVMLAMEKYGGSFVVALSKALAYADENNFRRIKEAFPELWFRYSAAAKGEVARAHIETHPTAEFRDDNT
jgi:hypothetical protein